MTEREFSLGFDWDRCRDCVVKWVSKKGSVICEDVMLVQFVFAVYQGNSAFLPDRMRTV